MKTKIISICFIVFLMLEILILKNSGTIITKYNTKEVWNGTTPIYRDLIMLSSLSYENLPSSCQTGNEGIITNGCMFKEADIEGLSKTKLLEMTRTPSAGIEDGQKYYYSNMGTVDELKDWKIVDNEVAKIPFNIGKLESEIKFVGYTFNKGNNYVITYRGTDFPDVLEWGQDVAYAIKRVNSMSKSAENYAVKMYNRISSACSTCNIYITGHSLGGYLAQVAAAKIVGNSYGNGRYNTNAYKQLSQVVYFNSIGVNSILSVDSSYTNEVNARISNLKQLALNNERVILYTIKGDAVSSIGDHYGEIRQLRAAANTKKALNSIVYDENDKNQATTWLNNLYGKLQVAYNYNLSNSDTVAKMTKQNFNSLKFILDLSTNKYSISKFDSNGNKNNTLTGINLIKSNVSNSMTEYGVNNIAELFSITHETDSFLCLVQDNRGSIPNVTVRGSSNTGTHVADTSTNKNIFYSNGDSNIVLTANVTGGCVQTYQWQKCTNESNCNNILKANSSTYTVNKALITKDLYYRVLIYYEGAYLRGKLINDIYNYQNITAGAKKINSEVYKIVYDNVAPECGFLTSSISMCRGSYATAKIMCTDNYGMDTNVSVANISPIVSSYKFNSTGRITTKNASITGNFYGVAAGSATVYIKDIRDYAGNINISKDSLYINVKRKWFNSEC